MSEPLALQAHAWLAQSHIGDLTPEQHADLLNLALACHQRMLEISEHDRSAAVELAIAGADLLEAFQRHAPPSSTIPEWVLVHEEQCCRYGAIWLHEQGEAEEQLPIKLLERGLSLLSRLTQFHQEPPSWIDIHRSDLQTLLKNQTTLQDLRMAVVGNCQAHPLMLGLRNALPNAAIHFCPSVHLATPKDVERLHNNLSHTNILITHRIQPGYRNSIGLDNSTLKKLLPTDSSTYILPSLHYEGHHPWISYAHIPEGKENIISQESPLGDYHDFLSMVAASEGLSSEILLQPNHNKSTEEILKKTHQESLSELRQRESECDIQISDWISDNHQKHPLMHTINHPVQALLEELLKRLLQRMGLTRNSKNLETNNHEHLGSLSIPIHPWVSAALQLDNWHESWGQKEGAFFGIKQQIQRSLSFYKRNPWILDANIHHPKARLAAELIANLNTGQSRPKDPLQRANTEKERAIDYAFLDPRNDFQQPQAINPSRPSLAWDQPLHIYRIGWRIEHSPLVLPVGIITEQGWLSDCLQHLPPHWASTSWMQSVGGFELSSSTTTPEEHHGESKNRVLQLKERDYVPEHVLAGRWCVLNDIVAHRNLGHFFHDLLPQLMAIRRLRQEWPNLQIIGNPERYHNLRILRELIIEKGWQQRPPHQRLRIEEVLLQPLAFNGGVGFFDKPETDWWLAAEELSEGLQLLRQKLEPDPSAKWRSHWVCFSRDLHRNTEALQGRTFSNYPKLLESLSNAGVLIVDPGQHDIRQMQLLVAGAKGFVGIHGAGLFNALLGEEGAKIIEIRPACGCWRDLELTCKVAKLDWTAVVCDPDISNPEQSVIPIATVLDLIG